MSSEPSQVRPYDALAAVYDAVMAHVDYEEWADYVLDLIAEHAPHARSVLELGCGTGSLAIEIQQRVEEILGLEEGFDYLATDGSERMLRVAQAKVGMQRARVGNLSLSKGDFTEIQVDRLFDVVLLLYDGLNYLRDESQVAGLLDRVAAALNQDGIAIIDQSTPANSLNNAAYFGDEGTVGDAAYVRRSRYEPDAHLHITEFEIRVEGEQYEEVHVQRAYSIAEVQSIIDGSHLEVVAAYDGFDMEPAGAASERIHWVLRKKRA